MGPPQMGVHNSWLVLTDREPTEPNWLKRAVIEIFYYPQSHLVLTLTLWQNDYDELGDEITVTKPLVCGQFGRGQFAEVSLSWSVDLAWTKWTPQKITFLNGSN